MYRTLTLEYKFLGKKFSCITFIDSLGFVAAKLNLNLAFVQLKYLTKKNLYSLHYILNTQKCNKLAAKISSHEEK